MTGSDFFHITEMITKNVELEMHQDTYDCILNSVFGSMPTSRTPDMNHHPIIFNNSMPLGEAIIHSRYAPMTKASTTFHLIC
jgi:hypothetical protein